jgi:hypothetical protein
VEALGKAKPFRTSGGRAALGFCLSGTRTGPYLGQGSVARPFGKCYSDRKAGRRTGARG